MKQDQHFATLNEDEIGEQLWHRVDQYYENIKKTGQLELWRRSYAAYYKALQHGGLLRFSGEQNEFSQVSVNHYRSLLQHKSALITKQRPAFEPRASNTDYTSQSQTILAKGLLDYYMREKRLENNLRTAVDLALRYGEGYIRVDWDATAGEKTTETPSGEPGSPEGDIRYDTFHPIDVIRDLTVENSDSNDWYICRSYKNRFDLIAKFCDTSGIDDEEIIRELDKLKQQILTIPSKEQLTNDGRLATFTNEANDLIALYSFYHAKTPAVPEGRLVTFLDANTILESGPLPYERVNIYPMVPEVIDGSPFGYTVAFDMLPLQEAVDGLHSAVITNQKTFAVQLVAIPNGSSISEASISDGLSIIYYNPIQAPSGGLPVAINLTSTPSEVFNYIEKLERLMETISGVNSVTRGNPESSLQSGAALALIQSMAIEFSVSLQHSYVALIEALGTATINMLKNYATTKRVAKIVGKSNRSMLKEFTGDDLSEVNRVTVDLGSPLARTTAGKLQILQTFMEAGVIKTQEQIIQVINTGTLEPATEGDTAEMMLIRSENEALSEGRPVPAIATDAHATHIMEHKTVLASPEMRQEPAILQATLAHIQDHINLLKNTDPALLSLIGQKSLVEPPPPSNGGNPGGADVLSGVLKPDQETIVPGPGMPNNPMTGQDFEPITGGLG